MKLLLMAVLPLEGVGVNELYANVPKVGRVLTKKGRDFKKNASIPSFWSQAKLPLSEKPMRLDLEFYGNWHTKSGEPRKRDVSGVIKALEDVVSSVIGVDDKWFYEVAARKIHASRPEIVVRLYALEDS